MKKKTEKKKVKKPVAKNGGARPGAGRKPFMPTENERKKVAAMSGYGVPVDGIAAVVRDGIHVSTLYEHFSKEIAQGRAKASSKVGQTLYQKAIGGDTTALIWYTKSRMGWKETQKHEIESPEGTMTPRVIDMSKLSDAALAEIIAAASSENNE